MDEDSQQAFAADIKRQHEHPWGSAREAPRTPYGNLKVGTLTSDAKPITERIADLCKRVADMGYEIARARTRHRATTRGLQESEAAFAKLTEELFQAIQEHRQDTPENVPSKAQSGPRTYIHGPSSSPDRRDALDMG